jgi:hypothetical protein
MSQCTLQISEGLFGAAYYSAIDSQTAYNKTKFSSKKRCFNPACTMNGVKTSRLDIE